MWVTVTAETEAALTRATNLPALGGGGEARKLS